MMLRSNLHRCYYFLRGHMFLLRALWIFGGSYGFVTLCSDVTEYANSGIIEQHLHYRVILIVIIYKLCIFSPPLGFELGSIKLKR